MYRHLNAQRIVNTVERLCRRVEERFPGSGLSRVSRELLEVARYLDYCSELLALVSKLAALHAQHLRDPVVLGAVNDVEELAAGLSQKIWQKLIVLGIRTGPQSPSEAAGA